MIEQISEYFTTEMIYVWLNIGVVPFWLILIVFPKSNICRFIVSSIFPIIVFATVYTYLVILFYKSGYNFLENFNGCSLIVPDTIRWNCPIVVIRRRNYQKA